MDCSANAILASLPADTMKVLEPHLSPFTLNSGDTLGEPRRRLTHGYFPLSGVLSFMVDLPGGGGVETGVIGRDGIFGGIQSLDHGRSINRVTVQISGEALSVPIAQLRKLMLELPELLKATINFEQFFFAQIQQTAACNAHHTVEQKFCKWLLRMHDLTESELPITQEFIAIMIGVRRTSVSAAAASLQRLGLIDYSRGKIRILDKAAMERHACECAQEVRTVYRDAFEKPLEDY